MNNSSMTMRPSKFVERGNIDTLTQIHDLSLSWFTRYYSSSSYVIEIRVACSIVSFLLSVLWSIICLLSFCFVCYSKTNDFWLQPWYLQTVLVIYNKSSQWFYCHLGTDCPFGATEYSRYSVGNSMLYLSFLCSVL
jgi:hypothetical protein